MTRFRLSSAGDLHGAPVLGWFCPLDEERGALDGPRGVGFERGTRSAGHA